MIPTAAFSSPLSIRSGWHEDSVGIHCKTTSKRINPVTVIERLRTRRSVVHLGHTSGHKLRQRQRALAIPLGRVVAAEVVELAVRGHRVARRVVRKILANQQHRTA